MAKQFEEIDLRRAFQPAVGAGSLAWPGDPDVGLCLQPEFGASDSSQQLGKT